MRKSFLTLTILLVAALPAMADIGAIQLVLQSSDDNGPSDLNPAVGIIDYGLGNIPATIPVTVRFGATTSGVDGSNAGVFAVYGDLTGSALAPQTTSMTLNTHFKAAMATPTTVYVTTYSTAIWYKGPKGLGFDAVTDAGSVIPGVLGEGVYGFGAAQVTSAGGQNFGTTDAKWVGHPTGSHPNVPFSNTAVPAPVVPANSAYAGGQVGALATPAVRENLTGIQLATGVLNLTGQPGVINLTGDGNLYVLDGSATAAANTLGGSLIIIPEPTTIGLLAPLALFLVRRRRA